MKKTTIFLVILMMVTTVFAGSVRNIEVPEDVKYDFNTGNKNWYKFGYHNVDVDADTLQGYTAEELAKDDSSTTIYTHGSTTSMRSMGLYLMDDRDFFENHPYGYFKIYMDDKYLEQKDFDELVRRMAMLQDKIDALQQRIYELETK